jgi:hypothetical protein
MDPNQSTCTDQVGAPVEACGENDLHEDASADKPSSGDPSREDPLHRLLNGMVADMLGGIRNHCQEDCDVTNNADTDDDTGSEASESTEASAAACAEIYDDTQLHLLLQAHLELVKAVCRKRR